MASSCPGRSTARARRGEAGTLRRIRASAPAANGTLIRKTPRQLHVVTSRPPMTGPDAAPIPAMEPQAPSARDRPAAVG